MASQSPYSANSTMEEHNAKAFAPMTFTELTDTKRLQLLLLPNPSGVPDIRLLHGRRFRKHIRAGGKLLRRQEMEERHPAVFCTEEEVVELLADTENEGDWTPNFRVTWPGIGALSYAWISAADPDPENEQMQLLCNVLKYIEAMRIAQKRKDDDYSRGLYRASSNFGVMVDFSSMYQLDAAGRRGPEERKSFARALHNIGLLYAHGRTLMLKIIDTPSALEADRTYIRRGWTLLEMCLADGQSRTEYSWDLSKWKELSVGFRDAFSNAEGTGETDDDLAATLRQQNDNWSLSSYNNEVVRTLMKGGGRSPPLNVQDFREEAGQRVFSFPGDVAVCVGIYKGIVEMVFAEKESVVFERVGFSDKGWGHMARSLPLHTNLQELSFIDGGMSGAQWSSICEGFAAGAPSPLRKLTLVRVGVGDGGSEALAAWMRSEKLASLTALDVVCCKVGEGGCRALARALGAGAAVQLAELDLSGNSGIGDTGVQALLPEGGGALQALKRRRSGDLQALKKLWLVDCGIGEEGFQRLLQALQEGMLPSLAELKINRIGAQSALVKYCEQHGINL